MTVRRALLCSLTVTALMLSSVLPAEAATVTRTFPVTIDFPHGDRPGKNTDCYATVFARWADVPNTQSVTVNYTFSGAPTSKGSSPPFNDNYPFYTDPPPFTLTVPEGGFHWLNLSYSSASGSTVPGTQCSGADQKNKELFAGPASVAITYTEATPPPPPPDKVKPTISGLAFGTGAFRAATSGPSFSAKAPVGSKVSFSLTEASKVKFTVTRKTSGRKVSRKCKAKTKSNAKKRKCTRYVKVAGSFTVTGKAGKNSFTFRGRVGGKSLKPGKYRLSGKATDSARNASVIRQKAFTIVK